MRDDHVIERHVRAMRNPSAQRYAQAYLRYLHGHAPRPLPPVLLQPAEARKVRDEINTLYFPKGA